MRHTENKKREMESEYFKTEQSIQINYLPNSVFENDFLLSRPCIWKVPTMNDTKLAQ